MSLPVVAMPDVEKLVVDYLQPPRLAAGTTVGTEWPADWLDKLAGGIVSVTLGGGGTRLKAVTADRTIDIDVLAATKAQARDLVAVVSAQLIAAQGTVQGSARVYDVSEVSVVWLPFQPSAETDPIPRYVLVMSMTVRPA